MVKVNYNFLHLCVVKNLSYCILRTMNTAVSELTYLMIQTVTEDLREGLVRVRDGRRTHHDAGRRAGLEQTVATLHHRLADVALGPHQDDVQLQHKSKDDDAAVRFSR